MIFMILWSASLLPWEFCSEIFAAGVERGVVTARSEATRQSMSEGFPAWIATAFGLNGMDAPTLNRHQMCQSGYLNNHFNEKERPT
ncbi:MAG: hypothetical protein NTU86_09735 [Burkholderiales bacterium]|nr:hypothetical protein [Burkholderiales bacterium]